MIGISVRINTAKLKRKSVAEKIFYSQSEFLRKYVHALTASFSFRNAFTYSHFRISHPDLLRRAKHEYEDKRAVITSSKMTRLQVNISRTRKHVKVVREGVQPEETESYFKSHCI